MADIHKIGLLILNADKTKFLVCAKSKDDVTSNYIMPGGQLEAGETDEQCLIREIDEELSVKLNLPIEYVCEYVDVAAGIPGKYVSIVLYEGTISGEPKPSQEIVELHWIGKDGSSRLSPIIKNKILPDLLSRNILQLL